MLLLELVPKLVGYHFLSSSLVHFATYSGQEPPT